MHLSILRLSTSPETTLGALYVDGGFRCWTLEDTARAVKVEGETRIPDGLYRLGLRTGSPMSARYQGNYTWHKYGMLWIREVPAFEWVYIHPGNTREDTRGCVLTGDSVNNNAVGDGKLLASRDAYRRLYEEVAPRVASETVSIRIANLG